MKLYVDHAFMRKWTISFLFVLSGWVSFAQDIPLGTWRSHFNYSKINFLSATSWGVFGASNHGIIQILNDNSISALSKANGLSGAQITCLGGDEEYLFIGYETGEIDIVTEDQIINILELQKSNLVGNKRINDVVRDGELTYFATNFGVLVVNLMDGTIKENYRSIGAGGANVTVKEIEILNEELYVISEEGVQKGSLSNNLLDFTQWSFFQNNEIDQYSELTSNDSRLFALSNDEAIVEIKLDGINNIYQSTGSLSQLTSNNGIFHFQESNDIFSLENNLSKLYKNIEGSHTNDILFKDGFWIADDFRGVINPNDESIILNGPMSDSFQNIKILKSQVYGFYNSVEQSDSTLNGFSFFDGYSWSYKDINQFPRISDIAYFDNDQFLASATSGIFRVSDSLNISDQEAQFLPSNTKASFEISSIVGTKKNLWVANYDNDLPLLQFDGAKWITYTDIEISTSRPTKLQLSDRGLVWIKGSNQNGLIVFDAEQKLTTKIDTGDGLPSNSVNSFEINSNDEVWMGTSRGIGNFPEASYAFDPFQVIVPVFGGQLLFDNTEVTSVINDGGNRIWAATSLGLWLFDKSISTLIHQFNTSNSPLPSNNIQHLTYNPSNGELFISTDQGLVSFRSSSSSSRPLFNDVEIFPNPILPGYDGLVGFKNLTKNTTVKITNINGKLISELISDGGTASWDLRDLNGKKITTGVYLVFLSNLDGSESLVGKVAVVN